MQQSPQAISPTTIRNEHTRTIKQLHFPITFCFGLPMEPDAPGVRPCVRKNQPNNPIIIIINKPTPPTQNKPSPANNHSGVRTWHKKGSAAWIVSPDGAARIL